MIGAQTRSTQAWSLMGQAEQPPSVLFGETEMELWPYRRRTVALLRRYARASVEVGRLPSLLGREFFRSRVTSYTMRNFEDVVIFVADMEQAIEKLNALEKKLLAMNVLEEYTIPEVARLLGCTQRTVERFLQDALDQLSRILLAGGLMEKLPSVEGERKTCQEGKNYNFDVSDSNEGKKRNYHLHKPLNQRPAAEGHLPERPWKNTVCIGLSDGQGMAYCVRCMNRPNCHRFL